MSNLIMSVSKGQSGSGDAVTCEALFSSLWLARGTASVKEKPIRRGEGALLRRGDEARFSGPQSAEWVRFDLTEGEAVPGAVLSAPVSRPAQPEKAACLLRLDQVSFPPGAVAYRHVHPGDGIRFLVGGELQVIGDTHTQTAVPGFAWFEPANSPVRAEASLAMPQTSFVRFMVLPSVYVGKPTIRILDQAEAQLPRKQVTSRHFDELVYLPSG